MGWFNYYGLAIMAIIMIPNIIYAVKHKNDVVNAYNNKTVIIAEQIGRFGCFAFMIFNIPYTYFNFWFNHALTVYLSVNGVMCLAYLVFWIICWKRNDILKALSLSILPSCIFLFSGIVLANLPLIAFSILFGVTHIYISCKNVVESKGGKKTKVNEKLKDAVIILFIILLMVCVVISVLFGKDTSI